MSDIILEAINLKKHFRSGGGLLRQAKTVKAVDGVSLRVHRGETLAIVGESGCGKSTLARVMMRLLEPSDGDVVFEDRTITDVRGGQLKKLRRDMQFIFQDPFSSLNPRMSVGRLVGEPLEAHMPELSAKERRRRVGELLERVGLRPAHADRYPHEFSGGQRQRIGIARALAVGPRLLIGDEPVSALDVSVQAQVINRLHALKDEFNLTLIIIAHDLAVIRHMSDRVAVMYLGQIVETGTVDQVFENPRHPYTLSLLSAIPEPVYGHARPRLPLVGETPSPANPPSGCRFHTRCPFAKADCATVMPALETRGGDHQVACHYAEDMAVHARELADNAAPPMRAEVARRFALYTNAVSAMEG